MAASDKVLGKLHEAVASALQEQVEGIMDGEVRIPPSPALLGAAIAFLKNNNITADAAENAALRNLNEALKARAKKKLPQQALDEAANTYALSLGAGEHLQ